MKVIETNKYLESKSFQAQTIEEEDEDRRNAEEKKRGYTEEMRQSWLRKRQAELENHHDLDDEYDKRDMKRTRMREVGEEGFLNAVERKGWVLIMLYEPVRLLFSF